VVVLVEVVEVVVVLMRQTPLVLEIHHQLHQAKEIILVHLLMMLVLVVAVLVQLVVTQPLQVAVMAVLVWQTPLQVLLRDNL
jgi:hypothetical protein